jgi:hypothetical protein
MTSELLDGSIFLHIPKTGGSWVSKVLADLGLLRHPIGRNPHTAYERAVMFPNRKPRWKEWTRSQNWCLENVTHPGRSMPIPFTFCFVRHPVRWYESWWRYLKGKTNIPWLEDAINQSRLLKCWSLSSVPSAAFCDDFNEFVRRIHKRFPGYVTWLYGQYAVPETNFVGRQESLRTDLLRVLKLRRLPFNETGVLQAPAANEALYSADTLLWEPELLRDVQAAEMPTLVRFHYPLLTPADLQTAAA